MSAVRDQIGALPLRWEKTGKLRVLMVTSRDTGRWVMPKGWTMDGKKPWHAAKIEALEEAGAVGFVSDRPIGIYHYDKRLGRNSVVPCRVTLYPMVVAKLKRRWKESGERKRHWFAPRKAARLVDENELSTLLKSLSERIEELNEMGDLRKAS
ncbi:NUDIX hydrolase [Tropicimonas marinistellae]|uniref:NUDIX hydrolase n=1 Tax=Tropicimonas marinistellae TaxID=1739787 RepID=UPI00083798E1|nr:NUDIX hydrolase [Tropicimonas marinistellae]